MRKGLLIILAYCASVGFANAAVRDSNTINRVTTPQATTNRHNTRITLPQITQSRHAASSAANNITKRTSDKKQTSTRNAINRPQPTHRVTNRNTTPQIQRTTVARISDLSATAQATETFGDGYTACRDAYFTCMDQFCAKQNETYRRCICSSRMADITSRETALGQTADSLQTFKDLNISVIDKTGAEVTAMVNASQGENAIHADKSASAAQLASISDVLSKTKTKSLSTQGSLDIAGDISTIWSTTDLTSGADIATLTGESLYNAVHSQCVEFMAPYCPTAAIQTMVTSAYGMYIENDCSALINSLDKKLSAANATIHDTEREMHSARLENYNKHNETSINDCVAKVRKDITAQTACGPNYVHCLDITGRYLNHDTGAPIYTADFYQLANQISMEGDILSNQTNTMIVTELTSMRPYATASLRTCEDISDYVWDEFLRQAIQEIYQGQQERVRTVKNECLDVVNECYDEQTQSLKEFNTTKNKLLLGQQLELAEEMCTEKLNTCSNLYGNMTLLVQAMHDITNQKIAQDCQTTLREYIEDICAVPSNDSLHHQPYACRTYTPGDASFATDPKCNENLDTTADASNGSTNTNTDQADCGDYIGSLYQKMARYSLGACVRPSQASSYEIPKTVLADINRVMDTVRVNMSQELSAECARLNGKWVTNAWVDTKSNFATETNDTPDNIHDYSGDTLFKPFYDETGANTNWGYCSETLAEKCARLGGTWVDERWEQPDASSLTANKVVQLGQFYNDINTPTNNNTINEIGYCQDTSQKRIFEAAIKLPGSTTDD